MTVDVYDTLVELSDQLTELDVNVKVTTPEFCVLLCVLLCVVLGVVPGVVLGAVLCVMSSVVLAIPLSVIPCTVL